MADFPWEILKAETLQFLSRDLGIKRYMKREEVIAFLHAVQKNGLGPALADEITKDLATSNQSRYATTQNDFDERVPPSSRSPISPVTRSKSVAVSPARRISTRKRPRPEPGPLFLPDSGGEENNDAQDEDEDAEGETDHEASESISTARRETRRSKGVKRVRLSEPGPGPGRTTRSRRDRDVDVSASTASVSAAATSGRTSATRTSLRRRSTTDEDAGESESAPGKRSTRRSRRHIPTEEREEVEEEKEAASEEEEEERYSGPQALAAALTRASRESRTARVRDFTTSSTAQSGSKPRPASASRPRPSSGMSARSAITPRTSKRNIKPTEKGSLSSPNKKPVSILSRPINSRQRPQAQTAKKARGKKVLDGVIMPSLSGIDRNRGYLDVNGRSESPREIFDGVVLKKRPIASDWNNGQGRDLPVHLDEFVANGLGRHGVNLNNGSPDPVLDRDEASSLGGSNKENDFSFRNDVSDSTEGPEDRLPIGEGDAEGEPEPEAGTGVNGEHQTQALVEQLNTDLNHVHRSPLHEVPLLQPENDLQLLPDSEPQLEPQVQPELAPELEPAPQAV